VNVTIPHHNCGNSTVRCIGEFYGYPLFLCPTCGRRMVDPIAHPRMPESEETIPVTLSALINSSDDNQVYELSRMFRR
jgi:hypothetical protein